MRREIFLFMRGKAKRIVSIFLALMMILTGIPGRQAAVKKATAAGVTYTVDSSIENVVNVIDTYSLIAFGKFEVTGHQNTNLLVNEFYGLDAAESDRFKNEFSVRDVPAGNSHPNYVRHFGNMDKVHSTEQNVRLAIFGTNNEKFYIGEGHSIGTQWDNNKYRPTIDGHILRGSNEIEQDTATKKYIDLANLQKSAGYYSGQLAKMENNGSVETKYAQNDCYIQVNDNSGLAVVNVTAGQLSNVSGTDMRVYFPAGSTSGLLINVDMNGQSTFFMKHNSIYIGGNMVENSENVYNKDINRIYWNFYDSSKGDGNYTGSIIINEEVFGTFIAPYATYESKGVNGNIIVNNAKITGESHKILHIHNLPAPQPINVADFGIIKTYEGAELTSMSDSERSTLLSGTEFTVYKNDGTTVVAGPKSLSWNAGKQRAEVLFEDIVCGTSANEYYFKIKETKAPKDYTKSDVIVDCKVVRDAKTGLLTAFYKRSTEGDAAYKTDFPTFDNTKKTPIHPEVEIGNWKYGETAKEPSIKKGGNPGEATVSYTYYKKNSDNTYAELSGKPKDAGTYKVVATVSETDKYQSGTAEKEFHIDKADNTLSAEKDLSVHRTEEGHEANTIDLSKYIYNAIGNVTYAIEGNAQGCSVDPNTGVLTSNKDEGVVKVKITAAGNGNYKEKSVEIKVHVTKKNINEATAQMKGWTYGEGPNVPVVTGNQSDKDPEFSYRRKDSDKYDKKVPEEPGDYVVRVKIPGNKNYEEAIILVEFSIEKATPTVTVSMDDWTYGETAKTPTHSEKGVKNEDKITVDSIRYKEKDAPDSAYTTDVPTEAGTYVVCVTTKEDAKYLSTSETAEFTIAKATDPCEVTNTADVMRGHSIDLSTLVSSEKGTVSYEIASDNTGASISGSKLTAGNTTGTIRVNVTIADSDNHKGRTEQITITVGDKDTISNPQVDITGWTYGKYDETANKPSVPNASNPGGATDITYRYKRADEGDDKYTAEVPTEAGTYYVQAVIPETDDYCGATPAKQFEIKKATYDMPTTAVTGVEVMRGGETSLKEYAKDANGTPSYSIETPVSGVSIDSDGKLTVDSTVPKDTEITVTITTPGDGNHDAASRTVTIKVLDKDPSTTMVSVSGKEYDGTTAISSISGIPDGVTPEIRYQKKNPSGVYEDIPSGTVPKDAGEYRIIVTTAETATICGATVEKEFVISHAPVTVTADDKTIVYGSGDPTLTYKTEGLKDESTILIVKLEIYPDTLEVGNHSITPVGEKIQGNYEITYVPGVLKVEKAEIPSESLKLEQKDITYGEELPVPVIKGLPDELDPNDLIIEYKPKEGGSYDTKAPTEAGNRMVGIAYFCGGDASELKMKLAELDKLRLYAGAFWEEALYAGDRMTVPARVFPHAYAVEINTYEQLRELDSSSNNLQAGAIAAICKVFGVRADEITDIAMLKKGMTNRSFLFSVRGEQYIMRIPGEGTDRLINRRQEAGVYAAIRGKGLCDDPVYINAETGYKITKYLPGVRICDPESREDLCRCMAKLREFHAMKLLVEHRFDVWQQIDFYESLWSAPQSLYRDYRETKSAVFRLKTWTDRQEKDCCLTHIDAVCDNFLFCGAECGNETLQLTDWEYAGMADPHMDLAMFAVYSAFGRAKLDRLIDLYFEGNCPDETRIKIYCYAAACGLLWSNWCEYKSSLGVEFGEYSLQQYRAAKEYARLAAKEMDML